MANRTKTTSSVEGINIEDALNNVRAQLDHDASVSPALRAAIDLLILMVSLLPNRFNLNSNNSSKAPASDPHRLKPVRKKSDKKPGDSPATV
jgi:transposase